MDIHETHCSSCISSSCTSALCIIEKCVFCHVSLHKCKIDEHIAEICRKAVVKCINSEYGCDKMLCRDRMPIHLQICPASIVVCTRDRCRQICAKSCKLELKTLGKQLKTSAIDDNMDLDVKLAIFDQNKIIKSYHSSRSSRVKQRDPLNPAHPLLPLRENPYDTSTVGPENEDSSEDEREERRERIRKSRMMFANCYMCQIDPSVQHLHTLGNGGDLEQARKRRITVQTTNAFHAKFGLRVSIDVQNIPEMTIKGENVREIKKGGTMYTIKCLKSVRRCEYGQHALSQHTETVDQLNQMIVRCPNWYKGCEFFTSRVKPRNGKLRLQVENDMITYQPEASDNGITAGEYEYMLDNLPLWVYDELSAYLPSSALLNLSMVNRSLQQIMFVWLKSRSYVEAHWHKPNENGGWMLGKFKWKFSKSEPAPVMDWNIPVDLSHHIPNCSFYDPIIYQESEKAVSIFPKELEPDIWKGFCDALSRRVIWEEMFDF